VIPSSVGFLRAECFHWCLSLQLVTFERPSGLTTINGRAFSECQSLDRLVIPASVRAIHAEAFVGSGISWMEIEEGSVSFKIRNEFLLDFKGRSLLWVFGFRKSIRIPCWIMQLGAYCCASKNGLKRIEFESDSNLRLIDAFAFCLCCRLKEVWIPPSVEVPREYCFHACSKFRKVTFGPGSRLGLIERYAFDRGKALRLVSVPALAQVIGPDQWSYANPSWRGPQSRRG
jgi:hypothetical protein